MRHMIAAVCLYAACSPRTAPTDTKLFVSKTGHEAEPKFDRSGLPKDAIAVDSDADLFPRALDRSNRRGQV